MPQEQLLEAFEVLQMNLEELGVAEEELRQKSEELAAARDDVESERRRYQELFECAPDSYLVTDAGGNILEANRAAATLLKVPQRFLLGKPLGLFVVDDELPTFRRGLAQMRQVSRKPEWEVRLRPRHGPPFPAALTVAAVRGVDGKLVALRWLVRDITERKQAQETQRHLRTLLEQEREIIQALMESFLGRTLQLPGLEVASIYEPAAQAQWVGGDYFDFIEIDRHRLGVVVGDVCGKGLPAALYTAMAKYTLRAYALEVVDPERVLPRVNQALYQQIIEEGMFVTLVYGVLDLEAGTFTYANAGHPAPVLYDPTTQRSRHLEVTGGIVGAFPDWRYQQRAVSLEPGAVLVLFTDGVTEATGGEAPPDGEGVAAILQEHARESADAIGRAMIGWAREQAGGNLRDEAALVTIRRR